MHLAAIVVAVALIVASYVFLFRSLNEHFQMQHEINAKLPPAGKFEPVFWWLGTRLRFRQLQKELMPDSPRPRKFRTFQMPSIVFFAAGMSLLVVTFRK